MYINTKLENFNIRYATKDDIGLILDFIKELAEYEEMLDLVEATEEILMESLFEEKYAEIVIGEYNNKPAAFALFFHNYSTFVGRPGLYLEDLFVKEEFRGKGIGTIMLAFLAKIAVERRCGRFEWWCLDWNKPSIDFYEKMGAKAMDEWTVFRVDDKALVDLAHKF